MTKLGEPFFGDVYGGIIREVSGPPVPPVSINQSYHFLQKSAHPFEANNYTVDLVGLSIPMGLK